MTDVLIVALVALACFWSGFAARHLAGKASSDATPGRTKSSVPQMFVKDEPPEIITIDMERDAEINARLEFTGRNTRR